MERLAGIGACHPRPSTVPYHPHLAVCRSRLFLSGAWSRRPCSSFSIHNGVDVPFKHQLSPAANANTTLVAAAASDGSQAATDVEAPATAVEEESPVLVTTKFVLERKCDFGEGFVVAGDHELLGAWDAQSAVPMAWSEGHVWSCQVDLPAGKQYEYKFVLTRKEAEPDWQPGPNRSFVTTDVSSALIVTESWEAVEAHGSSAEEVAEEVVSPEEATTENIFKEPEVDGVANEPSEPVAAAAESELTKPSTTESESVQDKEPQAVEVADVPASAEPELTDTASAHVIDQDDEALTEPTPSVVDDTKTAVEATAEEDTLSAAKATNEAATKEDEVTSVQAGDEVASVLATENSSPAEAKEVSTTPEESTAVIEDAKGFKSFKFGTGKAYK